MKVLITPMIPKKLALTMKISRYHLMALISSGSVKSRADTTVMAIMIIMIGETIPALTAASPKTRAPTIDRALVVKVGSLKSHSFNISKDDSINMASKKVGKGTGHC